MAFNINQFGNALKMAVTVSNNSNLVIPPGWLYDAYSDTYKKANGNDIESISAKAVRHYGGIPQALAAAHMANQIGVGVKPAKGDLRWNNGGYQEQYDGANWNRVAPTGPIGSPTGGLSYPGGAIGANGPAGPYDMSDIPIQQSPFISATSIEPAATIEVNGKLGKIKINLDTGELTMPPNVGRDAAIRDFWLGFQENFQAPAKVKYEREIADLKHNIQAWKDRATITDKEEYKKASKKITEKILAKYGSEKFIMVKPEDLIKFIQEE